MGAATCPWRLIEMKGKVLCGVCVDEMGGPLSCQSAFCGLLRDEESEHYRVTSVATASSGRGCLGYLAAPAALTVRNCLIKKSDKRKVFGKFNDRVGTMSGVMSDYTGVMSGPRASQGDVMCLRKGHLDPA